MMSTALKSSPPASAGLPVPFARVLAGLLAGIGPVLPHRAALAEAKGGVLASPLVVPSPVPGKAIALRRGYAVRSTDTLGAGPYSPLPLPAMPTLVEAGDVLPNGADAVLPEDAILAMGGLAEAQESAAPGAWARRIGEDAPAGTVLRGAGEVLRPLDIALAAAAGITHCEIRRPHLAVLGQDSAGPIARLLFEVARAAGASASAGEIASSRPDLVIAIGPPAEWATMLGGRAVQPVADRLALRPGEDGMASLLGTIPVLVVPNRLADALGIWLALARPVVAKLAGARDPAREDRRLTRKISSTIGISELVLLRRAGDSLEPLATGDLPLQVMAAADAWTIIPPESEGFAAGETVSAEFLVL
ncbi:hypothetical protein ACO2SS_13595 [Enterovirga sp. CN4-39]